MKYLFYSVLSALLLSLSWPVHGIPFFIFFALVPLMLMEHEIAHFSSIKRKMWTVFGLSYLAFFIWNAVTTGWLYGSKNPDGSHSVMAVAFPVIVNSLLYALVFTAYHGFKNKMGTYWGFAFLITFWMSFEKFHLTWELTWPWLNLGNVFSEYPKLIQWYDTLGATGGSFWILLVNVFAYYTFRVWQASRKRNILIRNSFFLMLSITIPMLVSWYKYEHFDWKPIGTVKVLMLQPDLDPYNEKYAKDSLQILDDLLHLAEGNSKGKIDYFIAPETALPGRGSLSETGFEQSILLNKIKEFLSHHPQSVFETGVSSHRLFRNGETTPPQAYPLQDGISVVSYNSALQIISNQRVEVYHKGKLVPGVEIFPYMSVLKPLLGDAMINLGGAVVSLGYDEKRTVFSNPYNAGKMAPIICYESIYGEFVTDYVREGANFLGIMTNDSWWGHTQGHEQLLSYARLRAIENRREIARAANSGISAHIDARGEIISDTLYDDETTLPSEINLYKEQTVYTRSGDMLSKICIFAFGFIIFYGMVQWLQEKTKKERKKIVIKR